MSQENSIQNWLWKVGPQTILERTLIAEYLLSRGYLMSELDELNFKFAQKLVQEACRFVALRMTEIEHGDNFQWRFRLPISLN